MLDELQAAPVVPLIQAEQPEVAVATANALAAGGLRVMEVVFRTVSALQCLQAVADSSDDVVVGAGTVLNADQARAAMDHGAKFIVSPGLDEGVVKVAQEHEVPIFPGVMTPGELQRAFNLGLDVVKFFPASIAGGVPALKALASVFRTMRFMPTGGVSISNLADFLSVPAVLACGGSWLTPASAIADGNFEEVTTLARQAVDVASQIRKG